MQNTKVTIKKIIFAVALAAVVLIAPQIASASGSTWSDADYDYYGYDDTPSYSYDTPSYSSPSYSYDTPSYSYDYDFPSYSNSGPSRIPSYSYDYAQPAAAPKSSSKSNAKSDANAKSYSYVYSKNENKLTNTNTSNNTNNNQNINNNNVNVVVYGGGGFSTTTYSNGGNNSQPQLVGDCQATPSVVTRGQNVSFSAYATGGTGSYTYSWSGSEGLSAYGQSFSGRFYSTGTKYAYVTISSGSQSVTRTCEVVVRDEYQNDNLSAYCVAEPQTAYVGQTVTWRVYPTGSNYNDGYNNSYGYTYNWTGTDGLYGSSQVITRSYSTSGTKTAYVTVYSNGRTYQTQCSANILGGSIGGTTYVPPTTGTPVSGVFLSQLPATGIDDMLAFKNILIASAIIIWAAFMAYVVNQKKRRNALHLTEDRVAAFKAANLAKRS